MSLSSSEMVEALRAAGEPTRLRILDLLRQDELSVMELVQILDQTQPRVSRHLKLLAEAGLVERFPDGAWVFYRCAAHGSQRALLDAALGMIDRADAILARDRLRLRDVAAARQAAATAYFTKNAARWEELRSLYVDEGEVEQEILKTAGQGPFNRLIDLGAGTGRMLTLLGPRAKSSLGLDLSRQMLNIARTRVAEAGLTDCEVRHGDIFATRLDSGSGDLVVVHQVLHYLIEPRAAVQEAARLVAPGGALLLIDFAPHRLEFLRSEHQHRRLGFSDDEIRDWCAAAGLKAFATTTLPARPGRKDGGLIVKIWRAERTAA